MTPFQKSVKNALATQSNVCLDHVTARKDGSVTAKRGYFYKFSTTAESWAEKVAAELTAAGISAHVYGQDAWAEWPKTSYFVAVISEK
jgi:hypothetical protein